MRAALPLPGSKCAVLRAKRGRRPRPWSVERAGRSENPDGGDSGGVGLRGLQNTAPGVTIGAMKAVTGEVRAADVQDQGVRRSRGAGGCDAVRSDPAHRRRVDRRRPRRWRHQAAHRSQGWRPVRGGPHDHAVSPQALAFFVYGFAESDRENLRRDELMTYRMLADEYLSLIAADIEAARATGTIIEVNCDDQAIQE